ncbi:MAG: SpoIID/LytB domain-containing protein [Deltaproteobacteria bacterium]|nr:SpoIID/LytB domain-containing protein [Deltaproteobacteria bacterium]MBI3077949.1 SpoIID/LytB domain-containing protein [Deltaproteobacteria bacterium]
MRRILPCVVVTAAALLPVPARSFTGPAVRIAVFKDIASAQIEGNGLSVLDLRTGEILGAEEARVDVTPQQVRMLERVGPWRPLSVRARSGLVTVNGRRFHDRIEVIQGERGLVVVNETAVEAYLIGLINAEVSSTWHPEALKAQAVAARTYALYQKARRRDLPYHLESTVADQLYLGAGLEDARAAAAVRETTGEVVTYRGQLILAAYHATSGGQTEDAADVWGERFPYLEGVACRFDGASPDYHWRYRIRQEELERLLRGASYPVRGLRQLEVVRWSKTQRALAVELVGDRGTKREIAARELRRIVGNDKIRSTFFTIWNIAGVFHFWGKGYGHGVGMCQWGAKGMADLGYGYGDILAYYYPGTTIKRLY